MMGKGTYDSPYTRKDVLRRIRNNGGTARGLDLSRKVFKRGIDLSDLDLSGIILQDVWLINAHLERSNLLVADLQRARLWECHLEDAVLIRTNLKYTWQSGTHLEGVRLQGAKFSSETSLDDANWGRYIIGEEIIGRYDQAQHIYLRLKMWYNNAGLYDEAGKFFFREMTAKRKQFWWGGYLEWMKRRGEHVPHSLKQVLRSYPRKPFHWAWSMLLNILCGYGEKPERVVISAAVVIFGLAVAYYFWGAFSASSFLDKLYYSVVSFVALGYGNWAPQPIGWAKYMGAVEAVIGVFMMALFLVTFIRKMTR